MLYGTVRRETFYFYFKTILVYILFARCKSLSVQRNAAFHWSILYMPDQKWIYHRVQVLYRKKCI